MDLLDQQLPNHHLDADKEGGQLAQRLTEPDGTGPTGKIERKNPNQDAFIMLMLESGFVSSAFEWVLTKRTKAW